MGYDLPELLGALCARAGGVRAAVVFERSGIEVGAWGDIDHEMVAAEVGELWKNACEAESSRSLGPVNGLDVRGEQGVWVAVPLGAEYVLALLADGHVPAGKVRFHATEWAHAHRGDFV